jgi:putative methyltransferase (TIGR04325 family)
MRRALSRLFRRILRQDRGSIRFTGNYKSWEDAEKASTGYSAPEILEKTRVAVLKVKSGRAEFERDSVAFNHVQYEFPLLAGLLRAAATANGRLSVLDFGGSLGSTYFQSRKFLPIMKDFHWSVVDQPAQVACGQNEFASEQLHFYPSIADCLAEQRPNVLLLSNVIQYLPQPYQFLEEIMSLKIPYIIMERIAFSSMGRDRLTVQHVPASIYSASYPAWFLSEPSFRAILEKNYDMVCEYRAGEAFHLEDGEVVFKGFQYQLKP